MLVDYAHCHQTTLSPREYISVNTACFSQHLATYDMYEDIDNHYLIQKFHMVYIEAVVD